MTDQIRSYNDLLKEEKRLEALLDAQKDVLYEDMNRIKRDLQPLRTAFEFVRKITTRERAGLLLDLGSELAIGGLLRKLLRSRAGWLTRMIVPFIVTNFSSHIIAEQKDKWLEKLKHWLNRNRNGKEHEKDEVEEQDNENS